MDNQTTTAEVKKHKLGLNLPTDPRWAHAAEKSIHEILTDHAYCEQKAATTCISLIVQYPDYPFLADELSPIVTEEWGHFRMVLNALKKRGLQLGSMRKDLYVNELMKYKRKGVSRAEQLVDKLLLAALIEARSCERFRLLSKAVKEEELSKFYHDLMVAEAGHYRLFIDLAQKVGEKEAVRSRWEEWLTIEADIMSRLAPDGSRMH